MEQFPEHWKEPPAPPGFVTPESFSLQGLLQEGRDALEKCCSSWYGEGQSGNLQGFLLGLGSFSVDLESTASRSAAQGTGLAQQK